MKIGKGFKELIGTTRKLGHSNCSDLDEEGRRNRIAFNSLYLFSSKSIIYEANGEALHNYTRGGPISSSPSGGLRVLPVFPRLYAQKHPGGVASMTRDRGYPDWLVLSALLRLLWAGYHNTKYMFWSCLACGYVKILQPVAMCSYFRNKTMLKPYVLASSIPCCTVKRPGPPPARPPAALHPPFAIY